MIDIQQLIEADQNLLLTLNGSDSMFWDGFMWIVSGTKMWIPVAAVLLYVIFKNTKFTQGLLILVMIALSVTLADQFSSGFCKPFFMRFRPAQDPEIMYMEPCCQYICFGYLYFTAYTQPVDDNDHVYLGFAFVVFAHISGSTLSGRYRLRCGCRFHHRFACLLALYIHPQEIF